MLITVQDLSSFSSSVIATGISNIFFFIFFLTLFVSIDRNVTVAREIDFFHRDILRWQSVRKPLFVVFVAFTAFGLVSTLTNYLPSSGEGVGFLAFFAFIGATFVYSGAAMIAIARSTYDRTMKKFVRMLGFAIFCFVAFVTIWIPLNGVYPNLGDIIASFFGIAAAYFFYEAAMSLFPRENREGSCLTVSFTGHSPSLLPVTSLVIITSRNYTAPLETMLGQNQNGFELDYSRRDCIENFIPA
jgi:hypothetical protein